ncbi:MAG: WecB/TagA/CpsF family glycosyltransferase [Bacteroidetes bacterium]|nr:MAG: WecB/TagA/CpsF family glycosyltransferase [Bacteroidota bacterium]
MKVLRKYQRHIIGSIAVTNIAYKGIVERIEYAISERNLLSIMYASAHIVNIAENDILLQEALSSADIVHPDGIGVWMASQLIYDIPFVERFNWSDFTIPFLRMCAERHWSIFFLGATEATLNLASTNLSKSLPSLQIAGMRNGYGAVDSAECIKEINRSGADILWVGMGSPKQNLWMKRHRSNITVPVVQAVGDAFAIVAGTKARGPKFIQKAGLEWLVRLLRHPVRFFTRYVIGIPFFMSIIIRQKLSMARTVRGA